MGFSDLAGFVGMVLWPYGLHVDCTVNHDCEGHDKTNNGLNKNTSLAFSLYLQWKSHYICQEVTEHSDVETFEEIA